MLSTSILTGVIVMNYFFDTSHFLKENPTYKKLHMISSIVLIISGTANIFLIKGRKKLKTEHKKWVRYLEIKFGMTLFLTPLINPIMWIFANS